MNIKSQERSSESQSPDNDAVKAAFEHWSNIIQPQSLKPNGNSAARTHNKVSAVGIDKIPKEDHNAPIEFWSRFLSKPSRAINLVEGTPGEAAKVKGGQTLEELEKAAAAAAANRTLQKSLKSSNDSVMKIAEITSLVDQAKVSEDSSAVKADLKQNFSVKLQSMPRTQWSSIKENPITLSQAEPKKPCLLLSIDKLTRNVEGVEETEDQRISSQTEEPYLLSPTDIKEIGFKDRMQTWVDSTECDRNSEVRVQELSRNTKALSIAASHDDDRSEFNPYLEKCMMRAQAAKERIFNSAPSQNNKRIKPRIGICLRHAKYDNALGLAGIYNTYIHSTAQSLDTKPITVDDMRQRIDTSRKEELPFIVAINEDLEKVRIKILGFVRLINFMDAQPSVSDTARLEIMIAHQVWGYNVGRCLMDALMTFVDAGYSPRGGYYFDTSGSENSSSESCRPLSHMVVNLSYINSDASRCARVKRWLAKEHRFYEKGCLPSVARKMGQP